MPYNLIDKYYSSTRPRHVSSVFNDLIPEISDYLQVSYFDDIKYQVYNDNFRMKSSKPKDLISIAKRDAARLSARDKRLILSREIIRYRIEKLQANFSLTQKVNSYLKKLKDITESLSTSTDFITQISSNTSEIDDNDPAAYFKKESILNKEIATIVKTALKNANTLIKKESKESKESKELQKKIAEFIDKKYLSKKEITELIKDFDKYIKALKTSDSIKRDKDKEIIGEINKNIISKMIALRLDPSFDNQTLLSIFAPNNYDGYDIKNKEDKLKEFSWTDKQYKDYDKVPLLYRAMLEPDILVRVVQVSSQHSFRATIKQDMLQKLGNRSKVVRDLDLTNNNDDFNTFIDNLYSAGKDLSEQTLKSPQPEVDSWQASNSKAIPKDIVRSSSTVGSYKSRRKRSTLANDKPRSSYDATPREISDRFNSSYILEKLFEGNNSKTAKVLHKKIAKDIKSKYISKPKVQQLDEINLGKISVDDSSMHLLNQAAGKYSHDITHTLAIIKEKYDILKNILKNDPFNLKYINIILSDIDEIKKNNNDARLNKKIDKLNKKYIRGSRNHPSLTTNILKQLIMLQQKIETNKHKDLYELELSLRRVFELEHFIENTPTHHSDIDLREINKMITYTKQHISNKKNYFYSMFENIKSTYNKINLNDDNLDDNKIDAINKLESNVTSMANVLIRVGSSQEYITPNLPKLEAMIKATYNTDEIKEKAKHFAGKLLDNTLSFAVEQSDNSKENINILNKLINTVVDAQVKIQLQDYNLDKSNKEINKLLADTKGVKEIKELLSNDIILLNTKIKYQKLVKQLFSIDSNDIDKVAAKQKEIASFVSLDNISNIIRDSYIENINIKSNLSAETKKSLTKSISAIIQKNFTNGILSSNHREFVPYKDGQEHSRSESQVRIRNSSEDSDQSSSFKI